MERKKISGVVVLYYPDEKLKENIESYIEGIDKLWIIDNTPDSNVDINLNFSDKLIYKKFGENKGIAYALNYACKEALNQGYEWILTMDQDSKFEKKSLENLINLTKKSDKIGIISPFHKTKGKEYAFENEIEEKEIAMTSGNLVNLKIFDKIGGFLEKLFIDEVDHEYCYRLKENGYKIIQVNSSILEHELGDIRIYNFFKIKILVTNHSYVRHYYMARNRIYIIKNYKQKRFSYIKMMFFGIFKIALFEHNRLKKIISLLEGIKDGIADKYGEYKK